MFNLKIITAQIILIYCHAFVYLLNITQSWLLRKYTRKLKEILPFDTKKRHSYAGRRPDFIALYCILGLRSDPQLQSTP
jgi:hypothetical protein